MSSSNCCFLTCIQLSWEAGQVVWYSHLFQNFPQFIVIHTVKGFGIVDKTEIDAFLEFSCFFNDPVDVGNLISGSSTFSAAAAAKPRQSWPTLWDPIDSSPQGSPVPGILQARTLEWVVISFSNAWKWKVKIESEVAESCLTLSDPWTVSLQAASSMGFSRQECWSGVPLHY